jgi:chloramphenicol-sensitive protein RarD
MAVVLAAIGVAAQVVMIGSLPVIALVLAFSFGLYGLLRKVAQVGAVVGLTVETTMLIPISLGYLMWLHRAGDLAFGSGDLRMDLLLIGAGFITTLPLLAFIQAARLLPLSTMGFLQYIAPSGHFLLAVLAYGEPFTLAHIVTFSCIWTALAIFTRDQLSTNRPTA